jgi:alpha-N-arabinofuranosidase
MLSTRKIFRSLIFALPVFYRLVDGATLTVSTTGGNASSPLLYGLMFEVQILFVSEYLTY